MSYIIDRRLNSKNKSTVNRQRFLERYRKHIKQAVNEAVNKRSITDIENGEKINIPGRDINEPVFHHGKGGRRDMVLPGNHDYNTGDTIDRPPQGAGGSGGKASDSGEGDDDFSFQISRDEFLDFLFEDLALPNMTKKHLTGADSFTRVHAGISSDGNPSQINIVRSLRSARVRRTALSGSKRKRLHELEAQLALLQENADEACRRARADIEDEIRHLRAKIDKIPFIDTFDLRYNIRSKQPKPTSKAVMFCIMDVSGSMTQTTKDIAKRFFILLYLFLKRSYEKIEVVFIRHHTAAKEVDEQEFFYSRETGGTIVSSALKLMKDIMAERYAPAEWNIYAAQASDGDNWNDDSDNCGKLLLNDILPALQYYAYIEITPREHQALWEEYEKIMAQHPADFAMRQIIEASDIFPIFRNLFQKQHIA
jgi:uncharacterized sporulation protein YeaH/YhbH (DUF444 family)